MISEVALRYAKALFEVIETSSQADQDRVLNEMRALSGGIGVKTEISQFFASPIVSSADKVKAFAALKGKLSAPVENLLSVMADKDRLEFIPDLAVALESLIDAKHGVTRGTVRSATALDAEQVKSLEATVRKVTGKQVILKFEVDPSLIGGLIAKVGGWTFDDSLTTHLTSMKEGLSRPLAN